MSHSVQGHCRHPTFPSRRRRSAARIVGALVGVALALTWISWAQHAHGHHILGLPHYKYGDDYPQIPYVEILGQVDTKALHFTYFPGTPKPGERVRFKLYVKDQRTGEPFREPLRAVVVRKQTLQRAEQLEVLELRTGQGPEGNDYKFFHVFDHPEAFEIRVTFPTSNGSEVVPFPVHIGVTDTRPLFGGAVAVLVLAIGTVAVVKRRRRRVQTGARS
ncbi:MAG: hypothetical protein JRI68_32955 [Deltaproteobacteria bacterium]|nr:hypothetical protein [Deltaproteobacteria bacterium]